jgi:hypothetical protein
MPRNLYRRGAIWWGRVQVAGTEHRRSLRTCDRAEANARFKTWKADLDRGARYGRSRHSWREAVTRYVHEVMPENLRPRTAARYLCSFRMVDPILAPLYLDQIDRRTRRRLPGARARPTRPGAATSPPCRRCCAPRAAGNG